eukprot:332586_1
MCSYLVGTLLCFIVHVSCSTLLGSPPRNHRSLLPKSAFHHVTNLSIEISEIAGQINHENMIQNIVLKLNNYYQDQYGNTEYNLSTIGYTISTQTVDLKLALYTKSVLILQDIEDAQAFIDKYISNPLYIVTIVHFNESVQRGQTKDAELEILIPLSLILLVIGFGAFMFWRWRRSEYHGHGEVFFAKDYKKREKKAIIVDPAGFATINIKEKKKQRKRNEEHKQGLDHEVVKENSDEEEEKTDVQSTDAAETEENEDVNEEEEQDEVDEEDSAHRSEHEEEDEKAEEIEFDTLTTKSGEEIKIEQHD